jgi:mRNA interferase MazF
MSTFKTFDVIVVPFPFTDRAEIKKRPALVLSSADHFNTKIDHSICAMITSAQHTQWPLDVIITDLESCGLQKPSLIRLKLFTLDNRLIYGTLGTLGSQDRKKLQKSLTLAFSELIY